MKRIILILALITSFAYAQTPITVAWKKNTTQDSIAAQYAGQTGGVDWFYRSLWIRTNYLRIIDSAFRYVTPYQLAHYAGTFYGTPTFKNGFTSSSTNTITNGTLVNQNTAGTIYTTMQNNAFVVSDAFGYTSFYRSGLAYVQNAGGATYVGFTTPTASRNINFPDKSGTVALLSDIPSVVGYTASNGVIKTGTNFTLDSAYARGLSQPQLNSLSSRITANTTSLAGKLNITDSTAFARTNGVYKGKYVQLAYGVTPSTPPSGYGDISLDANGSEMITKANGNTRTFKLPYAGNVNAYFPNAPTIHLADRDSVSTALLTKQNTLGYSASNTSPPFNRNLIFYGTSLTIGVGYGGVTSIPQTYPYQTAQQTGYSYINYAVGGQALQQLTTNDNSIYAQSAATVPPLTSNDVLVIDCMVNDIVKTGYDTVSYKSQLTTVVNRFISAGWSANKILLYNPSYYTTTSFGQTGIDARHTSYTAQARSVATTIGTLYFDSYSAMLTASGSQAANYYVYTDNLHMTPNGHAFAANALINFINTNISAPVNYSTSISSTVGNLITQGNAYVAGNLTNNGNFNNTGTSYFGGNILLAKIANITGNFAVNTTDTYGQAGVIGQLRLGTLNSVFTPTGTPNASGIFASTTGGAGASGVYPFNNAQNVVYFSRTSAFADHVFMGYNGSTANIVQSYIKGSTGAWNIGYTDGASHQYASNVPSLINVNSGIGINGSLTFTGAAGAYAANDFRSIQMLTAFTPVAANNSLRGAYFGSTFNTGTGLLTATANTVTDYINGTYTNVPAVNITGTGTGALFTVVVSGGGITTLTQTATASSGYANGNTFTFSAGFDGGTATDFVGTVASIGYSGVTATSAVFANAPIQLSTISDPTNKLAGMIWNNTNVLKVSLSSTYRLSLQTDVTASSGQIGISNSTGQFVPTSIVPVSSGGIGKAAVTVGAIQKGGATTTSALVDAVAGTDYAGLSSTNSFTGTNTFSTQSAGDNSTKAATTAFTAAAVAVETTRATTAEGTKQNLVTLTTTGSGAATFTQSTGALNIPTPATRTAVNVTGNLTMALNTDYQNISTTQYSLTLPPCTSFAVNGSQLITANATGTGGLKITVPSGYALNGSGGSTLTDGTGYITLTAHQKVQLIPSTTTANTYEYQVYNGTVTVH